MGVRREKRISTTLALVYVLEENMEVAREKQLWQLLALISVLKGDTVVGQDRLH
jgi:hypothetical protein